MANPTDVLMQLQAKLDTKYMIKNAQVSDDLEEDIGNQSTASTGSGFGNSLANKRYNPGDKDLDVPDAEAVDEPYVTNRGITIPDRDTSKNVATKKGGLSVEDIRLSLEQAVSPEASEKGMSTTDPGPDAPGHTDAAAAPPEGGEMPPEGGEMPADPSMAGGMEGGMGMEQEDPMHAKTPSELGRIYELKKIYTRLTTIESYLSESSDPELLRMRLLVSKSIELFEILASNIPVYKAPKAPKERLDEIIIMYYKFLKQVYESVAKYYKVNSSKLGSDGLKKTNITISSEELV